jgi:hypothetical protein
MNQLPNNIAVIGMVWYREADYDRLKAMFIDGEKLSPSFLQWQDLAEQGRKRFVREGRIVVKAYIDPETFPTWCATNGCNVDANGRNTFANTEARRVLLESQRHS